MLHVVAAILRSTVAEIRAHEHGLTQENFAKVRPGEQVDVDSDYWLAEEQRGGLTCLAAWENRQLVGYSVWSNHKSAVDAANLAISGAIHHTSPFGIRRLVALTKDVARHEGAHRFCWRTGYEPFGRFLRRQGARLLEVTYVEDL